MDINGGQLTQTNGNPSFPGTTFTGPLVAGNVIHGDGTTNLAGVGGVAGLANAGYVVMAQSSVVKQATNAGVAGVWVDPNIIVPAQSQILRMTMNVITPWSGASTTFGIGNTVSATAYTAAGAGDGSARDLASLIPSTQTQLGNWNNVGTSDVQVKITSTNTGNGVGVLTVEYLQGIDNGNS